jgi:hypothetical protein
MIFPVGKTFGMYAIFANVNVAIAIGKAGLLEK